MKVTANVAQLKARLSEYLRQVKGGTEVVVTERGVPVARLAPLDPEQRRATRLDRLLRAGLVRAPRAKLPKAFYTPPAGDPAIGDGILESMRAEREDDPR